MENMVKVLRVWKSNVLSYQQPKLTSLPLWVGCAQNVKKSGIFSCASFLQYISAVPQMQLMVAVNPVPPFPFMWSALFVYVKWEESNYPHEQFCCGRSSRNKYGL